MKEYSRKYRLIESYGTMVVDLIAIVCAYALAMILRTALPFGGDVAAISNSWAAGGIIPLGICILYDLSIRANHNVINRGPFEELVQVLKYNVLMYAFITAVLYVLHIGTEIPRLMLTYFFFLNVFFTYLFRHFFKLYIRKSYRKGRGSDKVLIVTDSATVARVIRHIKKDKAWSYEVKGLAVVDEDKRGEEIEGFKVVACNDDLLDVARQMPLDLVFFYAPGRHVDVEQWIQAFLTMGVRCYNCVERFTIKTPYSGVGNFANFHVLTYSMKELDYRMILIKRIMDIAGSSVGLLITAIALPFVAAAIKIEDPKGPVFFGQTRIGKNGRRFTIYKFRSMYKDAEARKKELMEKNEMKGLMFKMEDDPRITKVGKFIRKTSIDELPQFWNIFKGDMSLVGTRPPTVDEFEQYNDYYRRRMSITPGLTGMWQVSGRSDIDDFDEVVKLDLQYIDNWSVKEDIKILFMTVYVVLFGKGSR